MKRIASSLLLAIAVALFPPEPSWAAIDFGGDARFGYFARERDERDGTRTSSSDWRLRLRLGLEWQVGETLALKGRLAGRYSTDGTREHFQFFTAIPENEGLRFGDATFDELYLRYAPTESWSVTAGRMQTKFELEGVPRKSLSRNDSPNTEITWTDGVHARYTGAGGWDYHGILQRSEDEGPTTVRRAPLAFTESASHVTYYVGMEKKDEEGRFLQRGWDLTYIPEALHTDGIGRGRTEGYLAAAGRLALQWPVGEKTRLVWGIEAGYAPNTPTKAALGLPGAGRVSGVALQTSANLIDFAPGHSLGVVYGHVEGGWLLSPDFGNNQRLMEARYLWRLAPAHAFEARIRGRRELDQMTTAVRKREDSDFYFRYTVRF